MSARFVERHWLRRSPLSYGLWPFSLLFGAVVRLRRALYVRGFARSTRVRAPVVVVGNVFVGGTGKTPVVIALCEALRSRGLRPGIVSRGYRAGARVVREVSPDDRADAVGDEPLLLARRTGVPVWIGRDRVAAAQGLLERHPDCDVLICDDGLQHYALARDVELAVFDSRGPGNGFLLPAGPLREPVDRPVDARIYNGIERSDGFSMHLRPAFCYSLLEPGQAVSCESLKGKRLHAVAGIGHPERFFQSLRALGLSFTPHAFPDHHAYGVGDLAFADCDAVLMTEKDAVKCAPFASSLSAPPYPLYALRVEARIDPALFAFVESRLHGRTSA